MVKETRTTGRRKARAKAAAEPSKARRGRAASAPVDGVPAATKGGGPVTPEGKRVQTVAIFKRVTTIVWQRLSPTFGSRTINAIARNIIAREAPRHPILKRIGVTEQGLVWDDLRAHLEEVTADTLQEALEDFIDEFFEALANMIGRLVVGKLFKEAEQEAREGGER